ncbi:transporter [Parashewanella spongiae]|uniref:Curli production assembly/transport component CsgG n=1 Tax=Parashewanella spongiae TaxID=342950 RepID=A0A3A6U7P1_9GAMM|nr:CsgG/HfaB family protein [Parashewanella spongiae]MCL1078738.1 CsgG/HfaB family protein [Parashewanella spongiae]RJY17481.1 transporter [Parashewanella spongiae]
MKKLIMSFTLLSLTACSIVPKPDLNISPAQINLPSSTMLAIQKKASPKYPIPVAVYSFRDQTGQYKPQQNVSSFSTAVTQGATPILVQTLLDSNWFSPVEREGLQNLLTERKILQKNQVKKDKSNKHLPDLANARLLLEGGIVSYETNVSTGGIGAGYFGISASELYREDQVTVYLRAIDVHTGKVMLSVNTTKKIYSQEIRAGLTRFTSLSRLAEAEMGYTTNEPVQICVTQAIELAVSQLIDSGIEKGLWSGNSDSKAL